MKFNTVNDCLKEDPVATKTKNWGSYCKTIAWIAFIVLEIIVIIVSSALSTGQLGYELIGKGFILFLIGTVISFLNVTPMFIFGTILTAIAQIVQNTSVSAHSSMFLLSKHNSKPVSKPEITTPTVHQENTTSKWVCSYCGANNLPCDNICNNCGQKKVD